MILKTVKALVAGPYAIGIAATLGGCASDLPVDRLQTSQASHSFSPRVEIIDSPELASAGPMLVGWSTATGERSAHRYAPTATATEGGAVAQLAQLVVGDATPVVAPAMEMPPQLAEHAAVFDPDRSVQRTRGYITIRYGRALTGDSELATGYSYDGNGHHELLGASAGFNWGRYLGAELAVDNYEPAVRSDGIGVIGEYSASSVILQGRLRYPLLDGRLSPYIVGGAGIALTEFNDRTALGAMPLIGDFTGKEIIPAYSIGAGADYFIADNISIGGEGKYIFLKPEATSGGRVQTIDVSALMLGATLRLYFPGLPFEGSNDASARGDWSDLDWSQIHPYFGFRLGVPVFLDTQLTPEFEMPGKERQQLSSAIFGVDINRYFGAELTIDYSETDVDAIAVSAKVAELTIASATPMLRARYPVMGDRLVPYALAGVGLGFLEDNDRTVVGVDPTVPRISAQNFGVVGTIGAGLEYFIFNNMALGVESRYVRHNNTIEADGRDRTVELDTILLTTGLRIYLP